MDKNWLIRTKSNHILGPVSKEKVIELYHNGSIKPDDEVCSGNGYWFFIREDDLVSRFLLGSETQSFNPISEAKNVLTSRDASHEKEDLENDITLVEGISLSMLEDEELQGSQLIPPIPEEAPGPKPKTVPVVVKKKSKLEAKVKARKVYGPPKHQQWLKYLGLIGFLVLFLLIYFRKTILENIFPDEFSSLQINIFPAAHAQETTPEKKKSS